MFNEAARHSKKGGLTYFEIIPKKVTITNGASFQEPIAWSAVYSFEQYNKGNRTK